MHSELTTDAIDAVTQHHVTLSTLASLDSALAIVDRRTKSIVFVTDGFKAIVPNAEVNASWCGAVGSNAELNDALNDVLASDTAQQNRQVCIAKNRYQVEFKQLTNDQCVVSLLSVDSVTNNLHEYMQSRDNLFSTSRTISVSEMATTLAHEINTPIGTITNILRGIKMRMQKPDVSLDTLDAALTRALEQTQYTQSVINRIRDFTKSRRPQYREIDVREQVQEAVSLLDWMLTQNHCQVQMRLQIEPALVFGDATMMQQVLINLLRNAVDAMQSQSIEQRRIDVSVNTEDAKVLVSIADTGEGLENGTNNIFVPFATNKASGMGVGLNICRSFVELHQGRLWLSPNDTKGCTSFIELPVSDLEHGSMSDVTGL